MYAVLFQRTCIRIVFPLCRVPLDLDGVSSLCGCAAMQPKSVDLDLCKSYDATNAAQWNCILNELTNLNTCPLY